uniref:Monodehydroascorbate reductase n=1 Tax=Tanacetum cinerariifolium TaxID=118510 RepID=A0A6L2NDR8_TANCI|nr:hypothetical protein [Tanacetum cinerariifolium]
MHNCPRLLGQSFIEPPFEKEILAFLWFLRHSRAIRRLTDVNINKLHQLWRSFTAIVNKCLTGKSSGYDSLRLSQAQILWGLYQKRNVDFAYLMWEYFVCQVEHKDTKKSNEMYYPRFTKIIIHHFMSKDPSIPMRNKVNWHYVRDDHMFTTIKLVSSHQNTQQFGAMLPIELTNADIRNSDAYKDYYAVATGATPPKPKASVQKTRSSSDTTFTPPTAAADPRLSISAKGKQPATTSKAKRLSALSEVAMTETQQLKLATKRSLQQTHISQASSSGPGKGTGSIPGVPNVPTDEDQGQDEEDEEDELYKDVNINLGRGVQMVDVHTTQEFKDSHVTLTSVNPDGQQQSSSMDVHTPTSVTPIPVSAPTLTPSTIATITTTLQVLTSPTTAPSTLLQDLPNFGLLFGFNHRLKTLEANFSEFTQTNQLCDEAQKENDEFLKTIDENMQKIIKEQVKEQVKVQISKIKPKIEQTMNEQLEAKVLTRSSNSSKTSYTVTADLSEMELKKILIEKIEGNKSIHRSNEQRNLYKALVKAYESVKIILDTYGDTVTLKRCRDDDADKDEEPSVGSDRGSKRRREGKEPESASAPREKAARSAGKSTQGSKSRQTSASKSVTAEKPIQTTFEMEEPSHPEFETGADDQPIVEPSQHPEWFSQQKKPPTPDRD